MEEKFMMMKMI